MKFILLFCLLFFGLAANSSWASDRLVELLCEVAASTGTPKDTVVSEITSLLVDPSNELTGTGEKHPLYCISCIKDKDLKNNFLGLILDRKDLDLFNANYGCIQQNIRVPSPIVYLLEQSISDSNVEKLLDRPEFKVNTVSTVSPVKQEGPAYVTPILAAMAGGNLTAFRKILNHPEFEWSKNYTSSLDDGSIRIPLTALDSMLAIFSKDNGIRFSTGIGKSACPGCGNSGDLFYEKEVWKKFRDLTALTMTKEIFEKYPLAYDDFKLQQSRICKYNPLICGTALPISVLQEIYRHLDGFDPNERFQEWDKTINLFTYYDWYQQDLEVLKFYLNLPRLQFDGPISTTGLEWGTLSLGNDWRQYENVLAYIRKLTERFLNFPASTQLQLYRQVYEDPRAESIRSARELHSAIRDENDLIIRYLLETHQFSETLNTAILVVNDQPYYPLLGYRFYLSRPKNKEMIQLLTSYGADPNLRTGKWGLESSIMGVNPSAEKLFSTIEFLRSLPGYRPSWLEADGSSGSLLVDLVGAQPVDLNESIVYKVMQKFPDLLGEEKCGTLIKNLFAAADLKALELLLRDPTAKFIPCSSKPMLNPNNYIFSSSTWSSQNQSGLEEFVDLANRYWVHPGRSPVAPDLSHWNDFPLYNLKAVKFIVDTLAKDPNFLMKDFDENRILVKSASQFVKDGGKDPSVLNYLLDHPKLDLCLTVNIKYYVSSQGESVERILWRAGLNTDPVYVKLLKRQQESKCSR